MRVLVTGSAGFIGSHLVDHLISEGHDVWGIDNLSIGLKQNVSAKAESSFYRIDLVTERSRLNKTLKVIKPDIVYHLAAWAHEGLSQFCPIKVTENNYTAFLNMLVGSLNAGCKRFVVASSMSVYGDQTAPFDETMDTKPVDVYAVAKTAMEQTLEILSEVHGFVYTIIRPHNVYGPRQMLHDPYRNVVGIFMNRVMKGLPPIIYGDGLQTRAFSYIDDVVPYLAKAGFSKEAEGEIINVGPLEEYSIIELAREVLTAFGSDLKPSHYEDRPLEVKHAYCTNDKAIRILGYHTSTSLEDGIQKMAEWADTQGPQDFKYLEDGLELSENAPLTWKRREM